MFPGTLSHHQGVDIAVRALSLIKDRAPQVEFHIYGDGEQMDLIKSLIVDLELQNKVFIKNLVPLHQLSSVIENADLGIDPKRKDGFADEALAVKVFEFMSVGVPVLISDTTANRFYFTDSVVKFFEANSERSLAEAILLLVRNVQLRHSLIDKANDFVKKYTWDEHQAAYLNLVHSLVNRRRVNLKSEQVKPSII
jgi:glycosyltransferase involved in cell wall biosynthesis